MVNTLHSGVVIRHTLILTTIDLHTKFEVPKLHLFQRHGAKQNLTRDAVSAVESYKVVHLLQTFQMRFFVPLCRS